MKNTVKYVFVILFLISFGLISSCNSKKNNKVVFLENRKLKHLRAYPFKHEDVRLLEGPFLYATNVNERILLSYNPDKFLAKFRIEAGLEPKAEHYGGMEATTMAGAGLGHYLSACASMYKTTGKRDFLNPINYIVDELEFVQETHGNGYIGASSNAKYIMEEELAKGRIFSSEKELNTLYMPFYTQQKILQGLLDAAIIADNPKALKIALDFADWLGTIMQSLNHDQKQKVLECGYGSMNDALLNLYAITGNENYLEMAGDFYHEAVLFPLSEKKDILPGLHADTQIQKFIGLAKRYALTGNEKDKEIVDFFWSLLVDNYSYVTGGIGNHGYFGLVDSLSEGSSNGCSEVCAVSNMMKLSEQIFMWEANAKVADYYETALLNHVLASQHPFTGRVASFNSTEKGGAKFYHHPFDFSCCVGTAMESHSNYSKIIYHHNPKELFVTNFVASELKWKEKGLTLRQHTQFPVEEKTILEFECKRSIKLSLQIRHPSWAVDGFEILLNGESLDIKSKAGTFVAIERRWKNGDKLELRFPFNLRMETMPHNDNTVAIMKGPLVLAGLFEEKGDDMMDEAISIPVLKTKDRKPENWVEKLPDHPEAFYTKVAYPEDFVLMPFVMIHDSFYFVYFDLYANDN